MKRVEVLPYDEAWPTAFGRVRNELVTLLGDACSSIHHVGSTSVPGLPSKPVIDILVESPDLALIDSAAADLLNRGYEARGEYGIPGRRYFSRSGDGSALKVHLHAFASGDPRIGRHLLFRDYLRAHAPEAARYGGLKKRLASEHSDDRDAYQEAKAEHIERLHARALVWLERARSTR